MEFIQRIINTLRRPIVAIENISGTPLIEEAVMIIGIYGLLSAASSYIISSKTVIILEGAPKLNPELAGSIIIITSIVLAFITWFILAGIVHTISLAFGGNGKFYPHMVVLVGFAMLPLLLDNIINIFIFLKAQTNTLTISQIDSSANQQIFRDIQSKTTYLVSNIINFIAWVWSLAIIFLELKTYQKLSQGKALITVAIPLTFTIFILFVWR
jgi:hypothetical protein